MYRICNRKPLVLCLALAITFTLAFSVFAQQRILFEGTRGQDVRELQSSIQAYGIKLDVDGVFGPGTTMAVKDIQKAFGLKADGIVGPSTWNVVRRLEQSVVHVVNRGDTLWDLANYYGVSVNILSNFNDITQPNRLQVGAKILVPQVEGRGSIETDPIVYSVRRGDTLSSIAGQFGVSQSSIIRLNNLSNPNRLMIGDHLVIPDQRNALHDLNFIWPVQGVISSPFGWRSHPVWGHQQFHGGVDVAVPQGTPVKAAESGVIIESGNMGAYGLGVVIDHGYGIHTYYGHNSRLLAKVGTYVKRGDVIALSGNTGTSTGPHVDFRIKIYDKTVDPVPWLPAQR